MICSVEVTRAGGRVPRDDLATGNPKNVSVPAGVVTLIQDRIMGRYVVDVAHDEKQASIGIYTID